MSISETERRSHLLKDNLDVTNSKTYFGKIRQQLVAAHQFNDQDGEDERKGRGEGNCESGNGGRANGRCICIPSEAFITDGSDWSIKKLGCI